MKFETTDPVSWGRARLWHVYELRGGAYIHVGMVRAATEIEARVDWFTEHDS